MDNLINLEEKSGYLIYQLNLLWKREISRSIAEFDLTYTQYLVLMATAWIHLNDQTGSVTQARISEFLHIDRMLVSRMVNKLMQRKFIQTKEGCDGSRTQPLCVTDEGISILRKAVPQILDKEQDFYACLNKKEHKTLNQIMAKVLNYNQLKDQSQTSDK